MKIVISCSLSFPEEILAVKAKLEKQGHFVFIPPTTLDYIKGKRIKGKAKDEVKAKKDTNTLKTYFKEIKNSDALLVLNYSKKSIKNYIGPNTLIEMAFSHVLNKPIFLLNPIPDINSKSEILHMKPNIIKGNLNLLKT